MFKVDWDLYLEEDFMVCFEYLDEWSGDGIIVDYDNLEIQVVLQKVKVLVVGIGGLYVNLVDYLDVFYVVIDNYVLV